MNKNLPIGADEQRPCPACGGDIKHFGHYTRLFKCDLDDIKVAIAEARERFPENVTIDADACELLLKAYELKTVSDTPRTDSNNTFGQGRVPSELSRQLEIELNAAMLANQILRSAMYDIQEYDQWLYITGEKFGKCYRIAEKALTESALDGKGNL